MCARDETREEAGFERGRDVGSGEKQGGAY